MLRRPFRDPSGPARDKRHAHSALECGRLALAKRTSRSRVVAVRRPRPVIRREDDQRPVVDPCARDGIEHAPDRPVDLRDNVSVEALACPGRKRLRDEERHMRHRMREIEEERAPAVLLDEPHSPFGVHAGQLRLVRPQPDDFVSLDQWQFREVLRGRVIRPHVVGVREAEVLVEPVVRPVSSAARDAEHTACAT